MARFLNLDEDDGDAPILEDNQLRQEFLQKAQVHDETRAGDTGVDQTAEASPMASKTLTPVANAITEAFQCYPVVLSIASSIDLNTLDSLSRTTRHIHDGLVQYRTMLLASTLRCQNDGLPVDPDETLRYRARAGNWFYMEDSRSYNGKAGNCARDMVGGCRRCATVICRNCAIKPPAPMALRERHRRLCRACSKAPIATLITPPLAEALPLDSEAVQRGVCQCATEGVWLCQPCGRSIRGADHEYQRIWRWRNHYGEVLGGLGTDIGDGDRGVICGREEACSAAKECEQEIDCDAEYARENSTMPWSETPDTASTTPPTSFSAATPPVGPAHVLDAMRTDRTPSPSLAPGYERHEIVGIGGVVKRKLVRMVSVGACVAEWEDDGGGVLGKEVRGVARSWCGWCSRVIPGAKDRGEKKMS